MERVTVLEGELGGVEQALTEGPHDHVLVFVCMRAKRAL